MGGTASQWDWDDPSYARVRADYTGLVRAIVLELREPSDAMIDAAINCEGALEATYPDSDGYFTDGGVQKVWQAMIDASLSGK